MAISILSTATWEEIRDLDRARLVAILPVGAIEAHGPHLPLGTDGIIAESMARAGAERLAKRDHEVLILPTVSYTAAGFAAGFPGTISVPPENVASLLIDIAESLAKNGVPTLAIANSHLDPANLGSIRDAAAAVRERGLLRVVFPDVTRRQWADRLGAEFRSGACHAGRYESSIVLAARPDLVRDAIRGDLPPVPSSLTKAIRDGRTTFEEAGGARAYFGYPADATAAEGEQLIAELGTILEEAVREELASA